MRYRHPVLLALTVCLLFSPIACKREEAPPPPPPRAAAPPAAPAAPPAPAAPVPFTVVSADLGKQVTADKKVAAPSTAFSPTDTIYVSIATVGAAPTATLKARWTYEDGQLVNESSQTIAPTGPAATEFHIAKPTGFPTGKYKVEISANGAVAAEKEFVVD